MRKARGVLSENAKCIRRKTLGVLGAARDKGGEMPVFCTENLGANFSVREGG